MPAAQEVQDAIRRHLADHEDRLDRDYDEAHPELIPALDDGPQFVPHPDADFQRPLVPLRRPQRAPVLIPAPPRPYRFLNGHRLRLVGPEDDFDYIFRGHRYRRVNNEDPGVDVDLRQPRPDVPEAVVNLRHEVVVANLQIRDLVRAHIDFRSDLARQQEQHRDQNIQIRSLESQVEEQREECNNYRTEVNFLRARVDALEERLRPRTPPRPSVPTVDDNFGTIDIYPVDGEDSNGSDHVEALRPVVEVIPVEPIVDIRPAVDPPLARWRRIRARQLQSQYLNRIRNQELQRSDGSDSDYLD